MLIKVYGSAISGIVATTITIEVNVDKGIIKDIFKMNELVLHIVDVFNLGNIDYIYSKVYSPAILVISKIDVLPKSVKDEKLQKVLDEIRNKYGNDKIMYADMMKKKDE